MRISCRRVLSFSAPAGVPGPDLRQRLTTTFTASHLRPTVARSANLRGANVRGTALTMPISSVLVNRARQYSSASSSRSRLRRSVHFIPGDNDKFLGKCLAVGADTIILDLEDSVRDKAAGRAKVSAFLQDYAGTILFLIFRRLLSLLSRCGRLCGLFSVSV